MFKFIRKQSTNVEVNEVHSGSDAVLETGNRKHSSTLFKSSTIDSATARALSFQHGVPLHRYWIRGAVGLFVPTAMTVYWFLVWYVYFVVEEASESVRFGHNGGRWVFYSWFLIGIFGLNLSNYGLVGLEAGMMMDKRWAAKNAMQIMVHAEHTWGGPSGWMRVIRDMFVRGPNKPEPPTPLWSLLAFLTILPFVALPLTGLSYELKPGFHETGRHPSVIGLQRDNMNSITENGISVDAWMTGANSTIPGLSVIYTPKIGFDRKKHLTFRNFPNSLPDFEGVERAFLTAQAEVPISGKSWGVALQYNCSIVTKLSDFTILNLRNPSASAEEYAASYYPTDNKSLYIQLLNATSSNYSYAENHLSFMEEGVQTRHPPDYNGTGGDACYYWKHPTGEYPGLGEETVYEAVLWQYLDQNFAEDGRAPNYNVTIDSNITELYGARQAYVVREGVEPYYADMSAIGVRCTASSAVGEATIDGRDSTYTNFERMDTPIPYLEDTCMARLEWMAPSGIIAQAGEYSTFIWNLFRSVNTPSPYTANYTTVDDPNNKAKNNEFIQLSYFQASDLKKSLLRTYTIYANQIIYNGNSGYSNASGVQNITYINMDVTAFEVKKIFEDGDIKFWIPGALLLVWAVIYVALVLMYGFRRRWSATLDGYSMFRFGADFAESIRNRPEFGVNMGFEDCYPLKDIPGLIGDGNVGGKPGHITLVSGEEAVAAKDKLYM